MNIFRSIVYAFQEALTSIRVNKGLNAITIGTIAISMTLFGIFFLIFINLQKMAIDLGGKIKIIVYLKDNISQTQIEHLRRNIAFYKEIEKVSYVSKEDALINFKNKLMDKKAILDGLDSNPIPASFIIEIKEGFRTLDDMGRIANGLAGVEEVEEVEYGREWIDRFETFMVFFKLGMGAVGGVLTMGLLFIISNTIKLSVYSRLDEIEIMKLVGATNHFIKGPFIIEGMIQGFTGTIISIMLLFIGYEIIVSKLSFSVIFIFGFSDILFIPSNGIIWLVVSGIFLGFIGSLISMGRILKVRT